MAEDFGKYRLLRRIATGGMAEIYYARITGPSGFSKDLVVKKILPALASQREFIDMFADEARIVARMNHPNIVQVFDFGQVDGQYYIAMEFVDGQDLKSVIERFRTLSRPMNPRFALTVARDVARALQYAHGMKDSNGRSLGIIHRDVTPRNILISYQGAVKLTDFGVAKARARISHTRTGVIKGKFGYMAPEQVMGRGVDHRMDIFSLSTVLWEMLSLKRLFSGNSEAEILGKVLHQTVPSVQEYCPEHSPCVQGVLNEGLAKDPDLRFQTAGEMEGAINDCLGLLGGPEPDIGNVLQELFGEQQPMVDTEITMTAEQTLAMEDDEGTLLLEDETGREGPGSTVIPDESEPKKPKKKSLLPWVSVIILAALSAAAVGFWLHGGKKNAHPARGKAVTAIAPRVSSVRMENREPSGTKAALRRPPDPVTAPKPGKPQARRHKVPGFLTLNAVPWASVWIDGKKHGITPVTRLKLRPGRHKVVLRMKDRTRVFHVRIHPRKLTKRIVQMDKNAF